MKFEHLNHLDKTLRATLALLAFAFAALLLFDAVFFIIGLINKPDNWQSQIIYLFIRLFGTGGAVVLGWWLWQRSKHTYCTARGCGNPVASLDDTFCAECLQKREKGASDTAPVYSVAESDEPSSPVVVAEMTAEKVAEAEKPMLPESAPTIDKHICLLSHCKRTRYPEKPLCPECWEDWRMQKPLRCVRCGGDSANPLCKSCHQKWREWLKS